MTRDDLTLPEGRLGQLLAVGIALIILLAITLGVFEPVFDWYQQRQDSIGLQQQQVANITRMLPTIPIDRQKLSLLREQPSDKQILLAGSSDAIASAALQSEIGSLTSQAGASVASFAMRPVITAGALRRITIEVNLTATWPQLIALLGAIDTAQPRMLVNNLSVENSGQTKGFAPDIPLQVNFSIAAFRAG